MSSPQNQAQSFLFIHALSSWQHGESLVKSDVTSGASQSFVFLFYLLDNCSILCQLWFVCAKSFSTPYHHWNNSGWTSEIWHFLTWCLTWHYSFLAWCYRSIFLVPSALFIKPLNCLMVNFIGHGWSGNFKAWLLFLRVKNFCDPEFFPRISSYTLWRYRYYKNSVGFINRQLNSNLSFYLTISLFILDCTSFPSKES